MSFTGIILIGEPWDFASSDGENILKVRYVRKEKADFIFECLSDFDGYARYLMFGNRHASIDGQFSIAKIGDSIDEIDESALRIDLIGGMRESVFNDFLAWLYYNDREAFESL